MVDEFSVLSNFFGARPAALETDRLGHVRRIRMTEETDATARRHSATAVVRLWARVLSTLYAILASHLQTYSIDRLVFLAPWARTIACYEKVGQIVGGACP